MSDYDIYNVDTNTLEEASTVLERTLSRKFLQHDSSFYRGPYYSSGNSRGEHFQLFFKMDPYENEPIESEFPNVKWLLYVSETERSEELKNLLYSTGVCELLKHQSL